MSSSSPQKYNHVVRSLYLLAIITAISLLAMILVLSIPADLGAPYEPLTATDSYNFDPWEMALGRLHISFPEGGVMVGAFRRGELTAFVLIGEGTATFRGEEEERQFSLTQAVIQGHPSEISILRGQTFIEASVHPEAMQTAARLLQTVAVDEPLLEVFGVRKVFLPRRGVKIVSLFSQEGGRATYLQSRRTAWRQPGETEQVIANPEAPLYPPHDQFLFSLAILSVMVAAVAAGIVFVTPVYEHWTSPEKPKIPLWLPVGVALVHSGLEAYLNYLDLHQLVIVGWRVMVIAAVLWIADTQGNAFEFLGLRVRRLWNAFATGVWAGILLFLCGSIALPDGIRVVEPLALVGQLLYVTVSVAIFQELLWRGLVQGAFRQRYDAMTSIGLTTALAAVFSLAPALLTGTVTTAVLIQSFFIVPLSAFVLGFVYERTHNVAAPLATTATVYLLPLLLYFQ